MEVGGQRHAPAALPPGKRPCTHCKGEWVGPRTGVDGFGKFRRPPGFDLRTVQPVASRCTDWATLPTINSVRLVYFVQNVQHVFQAHQSHGTRVWAKGAITLGHVFISLVAWLVRVATFVMHSLKKSTLIMRFHGPPRPFLHRPINDIV
jgi:hypothetical protein